MNRGQVALALGAGYLLGRTKKLRWALLLATGGSRLRQGVKSLGSSGELAELAEPLRGRLMEAARAAAVTAASSGIENLTDRVHNRAESLQRSVRVPGGGEQEEQEERPSREARRGGTSRRSSEREPVEEYEEEDYEDEENYEDEDEVEGDYEDEDEDVADEDGSQQPEPARRGGGQAQGGRRTSRPTAGSSPIRRVRR